MRNLIVIILVIIGIHAYDLTGCRTASNAIAGVKELVDEDIERFRAYVADTLLTAIQKGNDADVLRERFLQARLLYKRMEWAAEYFMPTTTRLVNGPPVPEIENEEHKLTEPEGLQVMEALLYCDSIDYAAVERQTRLVLSRCIAYKRYWEAVEIDSAQVLEAVRLQVFRITTLGITGFDAPLAKSSLQEAAAGMQVLQQVANAFYADASMNTLFDNAIAYVRDGNDFDSFDRLHFIRAYCDPLTRQLARLQQERGIAFVNSRRLLKADATGLYDERVFDVNAYTPDSAYYTSEAKTLLGEKLFYDVRLSSDNSISCASCHDPRKGFSDGMITNVALNRTPLKRNTPTLLNAALQPWQFYDMRTTNLENQSRDVVENKDEMHGSLAVAVQRFAKDSAYHSLFKNAFPTALHVEEKHIQNAIASYVRSLALLNSRFDQYMQHKAGVELTREEKQGFNLFMGKARCGTCHFAPLFNGTVPPAFVKMESEVIGVPADRLGKTLDNDPGRYALFAMEPYERAFKTTTVRNVALTAPYMHNGVFSTLEEVVDFYDKGGGVGLGLEVGNQTLAADTLGLSDMEKRSLVAFMKALTDKTMAN